MRLKFCAAGEEGSGGHEYAYVGVLAVDGEGRDWTRESPKQRHVGGGLSTA